MINNRRFSDPMRKTPMRPVQEEPMDYRPIAWILFLTILIRLPFIHSPVYDYSGWRQSETAMIALNYYEDRLPFLHPEINWFGPHGTTETEFPLFPYLASWLYWGFGAADGFGRLLSVICSVGVGWAIWEIGRRLLHNRVGLLAAGFFAASPLAIYFGRAFQPDMMAVFFYTLAIASLLLGTRGMKDPWYYVSATALTLGMLLKPSGLLLALPIVWVFHERWGRKFYFQKEFWIYGILILISPLFWYYDSPVFFGHNVSSLITDFKNFPWDQVFFSHYRDPAFWSTLAYRIGDQILGYIGLIPLVFGVWRLFSPWKARPFFLIGGLGLLIYYLGGAAFHRNNDYDSLFTVPWFVLIAALGAEELGKRIKERLHISSAWIFVLPLLLAVVGFGLLLSRGWYGKLYAYYDDAVALQNLIPKSSMIAVMDEYPQYPEFFYFINRKGLHIMRGAGEEVDDSFWVEESRQKGATCYIGLTESADNHPMRYLQGRLQGRYLWTHYALESIGFRYFLARLDQPIYGNHFFSFYSGKTVAVPDSCRAAVASELPHTLPLSEWQNAEAILFDFHVMQPAELKACVSVYEAAIKQGYAMTHQESGRVWLEKSDRIDPIPSFLSLIASTRLYPGSIQPEHAYLGRFEPGAYRISFQLDDPQAKTGIELRIENREGKEISHKRILPIEYTHIREGERPECYVVLRQPEVLYAVVKSDTQATVPQSIVWMPDVQCLAPDAVIQAEQLNRQEARIIEDADADRGYALFCLSASEPRSACVGPYFPYPTGAYDVHFRVRSSRANLGSMYLMLLENRERILGELSLAREQLKPTYSEFGLTGRFTEISPVETRIFLPKNVEAVVDTIQIHQRSRLLPPVTFHMPVCLLPREGKPAVLTKGGRIINTDGMVESWVPLRKASLAKAAWSEKTGPLFLDEDGLVLDVTGNVVWSVSKTPQEKIVAFDVSEDGQTQAVLTDLPQVYIRNEGQIGKEPLLKTTIPPRAVRLLGARSALVLYGNGSLTPVGEAKPVEGIPDFGYDVSRALIRLSEGVYVVDSLGAIHSSADVPPIRSPFYKYEDWIIDAYRTAKGEWLYLTNGGEILTFTE